METRTINGKTYAEMLIGGISTLALHTQEINDLNVFPVADGDTGTNMVRTIEGGLGEISHTQTKNVGETSTNFARGVLLSARGNSGVILSQIFAGINEGLKNLESASATDLVSAYQMGIEKSYASVQNPTEGTILTVFRESVQNIAPFINENSCVKDFFKLHLQEARKSLIRTQEILPVLKESGVVDSGGAGYVYLAEGMYQALTGEILPEYKMQEEITESLPIDAFTRDSVLEYGYCTEFLLRLTTAKCNPDEFDIQTIISMLNELGGESIVSYKQDDVVKVHVHTFNPGLILARAQEYGEFLKVKVENMSLVHSNPQKVEKAESQEQPKKPFAVLAVALGEGMSELFKQMGADMIISGGQTSNPSAREFVDAFAKCNASEIIVLPNNKNVFLAVKQASEIYTKANVHIIESKNMMQGYGALNVITPGIKDINALVSSVKSAVNGVIGSEITKAVRDVTINGKVIKEGDYIAITDGDITAIESTPERAVISSLQQTDTDLSEIITLFIGRDANQEKSEELVEYITQTYPELEVVVHNGGQEVYDYMIAVE